MPYLTTLLTPQNLLFLIVLAGLAFGRIRIRRVSLGIAGILFVSILAGVLVDLLFPKTQIEMLSNVQSTMKSFSKLGASLFVSAIGLQTGFSITHNSKGSFVSFAIGVLMSISGVMMMLLISKLDPIVGYPTLLGILCGALTSTPGLSGVCELLGTNCEAAVWGYGCSYLPAVLLVVLFSRLFTCKENEQKTTVSSDTGSASKIYPVLLLIGIAALSGNMIGSIYISVLHSSLGSTACTLFIGLITGYVVRKKIPSVRPVPQDFNSIRILGLALFFAGTGFSAGMQSVCFHVKTVIYGVLITLTAILCGLFLCRVVSYRFRLNTGFVVAGGMTSSPAYGAISEQASELSVNHFSFAYFGALISSTITIQIIGR